jgi:hypothetical protein
VAGSATIAASPGVGRSIDADGVVARVDRLAAERGAPFYLRPAL